MSDERYWPTGFQEEFLKRLHEADIKPDAFDEMYRRAGREIAEDQWAQVNRVLLEERGLRAGFEARLQSRWQSALERFELFIHEALEAGQAINTTYRPDAAARSDQKFEALIRLHGRAAMTAQEVIVLLRSGYSTGAMARWRTLHEVWVVFALLADGDQELARRYLMHDTVESLKGEEDYERCWEALGYEAPDWDPDRRVAVRAEFENEFGAPFLQDYGWAAPLFKGKAPRGFKALEERADLGHWRAHYRLASHGAHANPKGILFNIQSGAEVDVIWAGPSNAGLADPAQCSLIALGNVTVALLAYAVTELIDGDDDLFDQVLALVRQQTVLMLMDDAITGFHRVSEVQDAETERQLELIARIADLLNMDPALDATALALRLGVELDEIAEAFDSPAGRARIPRSTTNLDLGS